MTIPLTTPSFTTYPSLDRFNRGYQSISSPPQKQEAQPPAPTATKPAWIPFAILGGGISVIAITLFLLNRKKTKGAKT